MGNPRGERQATSGNGILITIGGRKVKKCSGNVEKEAKGFWFKHGLAV